MEGQKLFWTFVILILFYSSTVLSQDTIETPNLYSELSGNFKIDYRYYPNEALYDGQHEQYFSGYFQPEIYLEWNKGKQLFQFTGFGRIDQYDTYSTHADLREFYWQMLFKKWEISVGLKKIFWGVTESNHIVDVINQLDGYEGFDIEQKLGQPMVHFSWSPKWGTIDIIAMSYFRQLHFPGPEGRPRPPSLLDYDKTAYESDLNEYQPEIAVRWSHSFSIFDFGLSQFFGTSRAPIFQTTDTVTFNAYYEQIGQTGIDVQAYTGSMLWKAEGIYRTSNRKIIKSYVVGGEYTFSNILQTGADLGLILEYNFDDRGPELLTALDNDMFFGIRIALNDRQSSDLLGGYILDMANQTQRYFVEINRRLGDSWKLSIEASGFNNIDESEFIYLIRNDNYLKVSLAKYF